MVKKNDKKVETWKDYIEDKLVELPFYGIWEFNGRIRSGTLGRFMEVRQNLEEEWCLNVEWKVLKIDYQQNQIQKKNMVA